MRYFEKIAILCWNPSEGSYSSGAGLWQRDSTPKITFSHSGQPESQNCFFCHNYIFTYNVYEDGQSGGYHTGIMDNDFFIMSDYCIYTIWATDPETENGDITCAVHGSTSTVCWKDKEERLPSHQHTKLLCIKVITRIWGLWNIYQKIWKWIKALFFHLVNLSWMLS
jgi:hypothetical protein